MEISLQKLNQPMETVSGYIAGRDLEQILHSQLLIAVIWLSNVSSWDSVRNYRHCTNIQNVDS